MSNLKQNDYLIDCSFSFAWMIIYIEGVWLALDWRTKEYNLSYNVHVTWLYQRSRQKGVRVRVGHKRGPKKNSQTVIWLWVLTVKSVVLLACGQLAVNSPVPSTHRQLNHYKVYTADGTQMACLSLALDPTKTVCNFKIQQDFNKIPGPAFSL